MARTKKTERDSPCVWRGDEDGVYHTDCGNAFFFDDGTAAENKIKFCGYCGCRLKAQEWRPR